MVAETTTGLSTTTTATTHTVVATVPSTPRSNSTPTPAFTVGQTVLGTVSQNSDGATGITLQGQFFSANLPPGLELGQTLTLVVKQTGQPLILELAPTPKHEQELIRTLLQKILDAGSPQLKLSDLRSVSVLENLPLPQLLGLNTTDRQVGDQSNTSFRDQSPFLKALGQLVVRELFLNSDQAANPAKFTEFLMNITLGKQLSNIKDAKQSLELLAQQDNQPLLQTKVEPLLKGVLHELKNILLQTKDIAPTTEELSHTAKELGLPFTLRLSEIAQQAGLPLLAQQLALFATEKSFPTEPLPLFQKIFQSIQLMLKAQPEQFSQEFHTLIRQATQESAALLHQPADLTTLRRTVDHQLEQLSNLMARTRLGTNDRSQLLQTEKALRNVDQFLLGQETIQRLNPLMRAMGEPIFVLIPALLQGLVQNWEMVIEPRHVFHEQSGERKNTEDYERIHLYIDLPSLGPIQIDLAYRTQELLLSMTFSNEEATDFVDTRLPKLESILIALGYQKAQLITRTGTPERCQPEWVSEVRSQRVVV